MPTASRRGAGPAGPARTGRRRRSRDRAAGGSDASTDVDGSTNVDGSIDVAGSTDVNGSIDVDGSIAVDGSADVDGSTGVDGSADADGPRDAEVDPEADPYSVAQTICLRLLTARPHSRAELATALARRGVPPEVTEQLLARFTDLGYVDDAAFAQAWVESRHAGRGLARRALAHELRGKGVDESTLRDAVDLVDADAELERARELVARRLAGTRALPVEARVRRLAGMLARKGYPPGLAVRVVRDALAGEAPDELIAGLDTED